MIPIYKPYLPQESLKHVNDALNSTWISSHGYYIDKAAERLQDLLNVKHVLLTNNGTSATHLISKAIKFKNSNIDKLIVPNNVFIAAINSFLFDKDYKLDCIDADLETWNFNLSLLDVKLKNQANVGVLAVHNVGNIINVPKLKMKYPDLIIVEDNCEGFLGKYNDKYTGTESLCSSVSFFGNKNITSGEGGAFITNDTDLFEYAKCIHGQGQSKEKFIHDYLGYNYRITNIQAAILLGQIELLDEILDKKKKVFEYYQYRLKDVDKLSIQLKDEDTNAANWMFGIRIIGSEYKKAAKYFSDYNIEVRPMFYPLNSHKYLINNPYINLGKNKNAKLLNEECMILPSFPELTLSELDQIINTVLFYIETL